MCLDRSNYGSQHRNWKGFFRIDNALDPILRKEIEEE